VRIEKNRYLRIPQHKDTCYARYMESGPDCVILVRYLEGDAQIANNLTMEILGKFRELYPCISIAHQIEYKD
jgi:hypothetical protein